MLDSPTRVHADGSFARQDDSNVRNFAIRVNNLSKLYRLGAREHGAYRTLRESLARAAQSSWSRLRRAALSRGDRTQGQAESNGQAATATIWALHDVTFDVRPGEVVGIIGRNGAGKSTLLKVLSRITEPTQGRVELRGRIASLLEVGTGFHPELTGRENILLNGSILGMGRREILRKFDEIVAFAEVDDFLDTPVKRFSSGMYVRLAFAVASHLESEILVVDEVLAVGDQAFQRKCLGKMDQVSHSGRTVLFVSHNMAAVQNLCGRVVVLDHGRVEYIGSTLDGVRMYAAQHGDCEGGTVDLDGHRTRSPNSEPILRSVCLINGEGEPTTQFRCGEPMVIELVAQPQRPLANLDFGVHCNDGFGTRLFTVGTFMSETRAIEGRGTVVVRGTIDELALPPGRYFLSLFAGPAQRRKTDLLNDVMAFDVVSHDYYHNGCAPNPVRGQFLVRSHWSCVAPQ